MALSEVPDLASEVVSSVIWSARFVGASIESGSSGIGRWPRSRSLDSGEDGIGIGEFDERARVIRRIARLRRRDRLFDALLRKAEERVTVRGVPPMFTLRPALRDLQARGSAPRAVVDAVAAADRANNHMRFLVDRLPWPSREQIGWTGSFAAAALIAHADDDSALRRTAIARMRISLESDGVDPRYFAHVVDRSNALDGKPQEYGTLFVPVDGVPRFVWPIVGDDEIEDARRAIGLPTIANDQDRYERGARPGSFLAPYTRADWLRLGARLTLSGLKHARRAP